MKQNKKNQNEDVKGSSSILFLPKMDISLFGLKLLTEPLDSNHPMSLLSWERGLKYGIKAVTKSVGNGRSSRGSVD